MFNTCAEKPVLAAKMITHKADVHAGGIHDVLNCGASISFFGEQGRSFRDEKLSSSLMNMAEDTEIIPYIMVEQINAAGNVVKTTLIKPLSETIKSKSVQPLYAEYPAHEDAKSVRVKLTLIKPEEEAPGSAELTEEGTEDDGDNRIDNQTNEAETETKSSPE